MIKATELRIGNLFCGNVNERQKEYMSDEYIYVITEIKSLKVNVNLIEDYAMNIYKSTHLSYDKINPVPITEEWLLKFGAKKHKYGSGFLINSYYFLQMGNGSYQMGILFADTTITDLSNIKYVHQLQNLYFALTGNELEIKEPQPA